MTFENFAEVIAKALELAGILLLLLGLLILIRTFLSIEMEMEIDGHWPWQRTKLDSGERASGDTA